MVFVSGEILTAAELNAFSTTTIVTTGNVGIGTASPAELLDIHGNANAQGTTIPTVRITNTDTTAAATDVTGSFEFFSKDASDADEVSGYVRNVAVNAGTQFALTLGTKNNAASVVEAMRIDHLGRVGIGTTAPADLLDVGDGSTAGSFRVHASGGGESFRVAGTLVRSTNIRDITTANAANVYVATSNGTMYRSTSSIKYKSPVEDLEDAYADRVLEMRPVWYRSITGNDPAGHSYYGLIAEEVAAIDPRLVSFGPLADCVCPDDPDDPGVTAHTPECLTEPEGVQYDRLVPHLISVAQRQAAELAALTARLEALESPA